LTIKIKSLLHISKYFRILTSSAKILFIQIISKQITAHTFIINEFDSCGVHVIHIDVSESYWPYRLAPSENSFSARPIFPKWLVLPQFS
jgi:hypothetical protein